jgi:hypothetical protein
LAILTSLTIMLETATDSMLIPNAISIMIF